MTPLNYELKMVYNYQYCLTYLTVAVVEPGESHPSSVSDISCVQTQEGNKLEGIYVRMFLNRKFDK